MSTCELCGFEGASTRKATVHGSLLDCCTKCIDSMGLIIERKAVKIPESIPDSQVVGKGISGMDIMTKEELELSPDFHSRIREAREGRSLSQEEFAKSINLKIGAIQKAENGIRPTDDILKKISKSLGIELFVESVSRNSRMVKSSSHREMTISDVSDGDSAPRRIKSPKKKSRKLGVSRKGARKGDGK